MANNMSVRKLTLQFINLSTIYFEHDNVAFYVFRYENKCNVCCECNQSIGIYILKNIFKIN